jgi:hypothetical protein
LPSARACLLKLEPSRWLLAWWLALHLLLGLTLLMVNTLAGLGGIALLAAHCRWRNPARRTLLVISPGGRFALPAAGRFDLTLSAATRYGRWWAELVFSDRPGGLLLLRDQFTDGQWRRLCLELAESD